MLRVLKGPLSKLIGKHYFMTKQFTNRCPSSIMNIFSNFIPNIPRNPPWMNDFVKIKIKFKNQQHNTDTKMFIRTMIVICFKKQ